MQLPAGEAILNMCFLYHVLGTSYLAAIFNLYYDYHPRNVRNPHFLELHLVCVCLNAALCDNVSRSDAYSGSS